MVFGMSFLGNMAGLFVSTSEGGEAAAGMVSGLIGGVGLLFGLFLLVFALLPYFIASGFWKGSHWPITFTAIFSALGVAGGLAGMDLAALLSSAVVLALALSIWKHPFYRKV